METSRISGDGRGTRIANPEGMAHYHAAVWLDHNEARIFHVTAESFDETTILSPKAHVQLHRKSGPGGESGHRHPGDPHFYGEIEKALTDAQKVLVLGPSTAKLELMSHVRKHAHDLEARIVGVEAVDHPSDRELVRYIRRYFDIPDRLPTAPPPYEAQKRPEKPELAPEPTDI